MPLSAPGLASPGQASPGALGGSVVVVSGPLSISGSTSITIASSEISSNVSLSLDGTASITVASTLQEAFSGALSVAGAGSITIVNTPLGAFSGALLVAGIASITIVSAGIPDDMLRVVLTATYHNRADGDPARGKVSFRLSDEIRDAVDNITAARVRHRANLRDGAFTVNLPVKAGGVAYVVVEEIEGADKRRFTITIPATPASQTLAEVI